MMNPTPMKIVLAICFLFGMTACEKHSELIPVESSEPDQPACSIEVTYEGNHPCLGQYLRITSGDLLRAMDFPIQLDPKTDVGRKFLISYDNTDLEYDCMVIVPVESIPVTVNCAREISTE